MLGASGEPKHIWREVVGMGDTTGSSMQVLDLSPRLTEIMPMILGLLILVLPILILGILLVRYSRKARKQIPELRPGDTKKNPGVAVVLSFLFCGLGHLYNGQISKGILYLVLYGVSIALTVNLILRGIYAPVFFVLLFVVFLWIEGIIGANETARKINILLDYLNKEKGDYSSIRDRSLEIDLKAGRVVEEMKEIALCVNCWLLGDCEREKEAIKKRKTITDCRGYVPEDRRIG